MESSLPYRHRGERNDFPPSAAAFLRESVSDAYYRHHGNDLRRGIGNQSAGLDLAPRIPCSLVSGGRCDAVCCPSGVPKSGKVTYTILPQQPGIGAGVSLCGGALLGLVESSRHTLAGGAPRVTLLLDSDTSLKLGPYI